MTTKKGFGGAKFQLNSGDDAARAQAEKLRREAEEAKKAREQGPKGKAPVVEGLNVLMILPSYNEENAMFIRLTLFHYNPFIHVCSRPAPIFDPDDATQVIFSKKFSNDGKDGEEPYNCDQCSSGWAAVSNYMKANGIKSLKEVPRTSKPSMFYSDNKAVVQGIYQAVNLTGFFFLDKGKTIPTLDVKLYNEWYETFMKVVCKEMEAPEDMPENLKLQCQAGIQIMLSNQILAKEIKKAVITRYEEEQEYPLIMPEKYLISVVKAKDPSSKFEGKDGEQREGFSYTVNCFKTAVAGNGKAWKVPDSFLDYAEEKAEDIYNINYEGDRIEDKAAAFHSLTDDELYQLCLKYGTDIKNHVNVPREKKEVPEDDGADLPPPSKSSGYNSRTDFDDTGDDEDDEILNVAKMKRGKK